MGVRVSGCAGVRVCGWRHKGGVGEAGTEGLGLGFWARVRVRVGEAGTEGWPHDRCWPAICWPWPQERILPDWG